MTDHDAQAMLSEQPLHTMEVRLEKFDTGGRWLPRIDERWVLRCSCGFEKVVRYDCQLDRIEHKLDVLLSLPVETDRQRLVLEKIAESHQACGHAAWAKEVLA